MYGCSMPRRSTTSPTPGLPDEIDLNQVVSYNLKAARELRNLTQADLADRLEPLLGSRPTQATISALERAWGSDRRREFDAQQLVVYATALDVPIAWFFLPPPGDFREIKGVGRPLNDLYILLLGRDDQLEFMYDRLSQIGIQDPTPADVTVEKILGFDSLETRWSYRERRKKLLRAVLNRHADKLDDAVEDIGEFFDHLRQVGMQGFIAEKTGDADFAKKYGFFEGED